jgi:hypothetical protein
MLDVDWGQKNPQTWVTVGVICEKNKNTGSGRHTSSEKANAPHGWIRIGCLADVLGRHDELICVPYYISIFNPLRFITQIHLVKRLCPGRKYAPTVPFLGMHNDCKSSAGTRECATNVAYQMSKNVPLINKHKLKFYFESALPHAD